MEVKECGYFKASVHIAKLLSKMIVAIYTPAKPPNWSFFKVAYYMIAATIELHLCCESVMWKELDSPPPPFFRFQTFVNKIK